MGVRTEEAVEMGSSSKVGRPEAQVTAGKARPSRFVKLRERDKQLLCVLATARYLTAEQLGRLIFGGRAEATRKRLLLLSGERKRSHAPKYLRKLSYQTRGGDWVAVWTPSDAGYYVAERVLGQVRQPTSDVGPAFLAHSIALNELLVRILCATLPPALPGAKVGAGGTRAEESAFVHLPDERFRWLASDTARLPWTEYEAATRAQRQRIIQPDAVLELLVDGRRIFIECEMGTHSVQAISPDKDGSTLAKIERYANFLTGFADVPKKQTFYSRTYPDGLAPEILFLVQSDARSKSIAAAFSRWSGQQIGRDISVRALTLEPAAQDISKALGLGVPAAAKGTAAAATGLDANSLQLLREFYVGTYAAFKSMRDGARARHAPVPDYPPRTSDVAELLSRLGVSLNPAK